MQQQQQQDRAPPGAGTGDRKRPATIADDDNRVSVEGGVSGALACVKGPEAGLTLALAPGSYTIGRARENDLVLKDIAASRKHLRIDVNESGARLVDLGSGNGSRVNGKRASECELRHGDSIEIGASVIVYSEPGRIATVDKGPARDEAQARVVAAADELAKELSQKLRFGDDAGNEFDGHKAQTRAIRTADARAAAAALAAEAAAEDAAAQKKPGDRLWNETFTNMPLSAVVAGDQRLQGTRDLPKKPPARPMTPMPVTPPRSMGPVGTAAAPDDRYDDEPLLEELSQAPRGSFVTSVLLSAGVVVVVGALALGLWAMFFREAPTPTTVVSAGEVVQAEKDAEYAKAISRAQDAITRQDWVAVRDYTVVALQSRPKDPLALAYKGDAEQRIDAALKAASEPPPPAPAPPPAPEAAPPPPPPVAAPAPPPPPPRAAPAPPPRAPPKQRTSTPTKRTISDDEAKARFERAIDAFRSKDNVTGCKLLEQVADRASSESTWRGKADSLYLKRCGG
jgi:hypothetical protein